VLAKFLAGKGVGFMKQVKLSNHYGSLGSNPPTTTVVVSDGLGVSVNVCVSVTLLTQEGVPASKSFKALFV
jgi:hypothetical protein